MRKALVAIGLAACLSTSSCVGPYNAFNSVGSWNTRATDSKWLNELIHIGLWIVPVYQFAALGDMVIFNSFEFWGGTNPISAPEPYQDQSDL